MFSFSNTLPAAYVTLEGTELAPELKGIVYFYEVYDGTLVLASLQGLSNQNGFHAFHIHNGNTCAEPGTHYNPTNQMHPNHAGDLPPLLVCNGSAFLACYTNRFFPDEIIGKTVIVHSMPDDFSSQPSGNPGQIIACAVIEEKD